MRNWFPLRDIPKSVERVSGQSKCGIKFLGAPIGHEDFCKKFCLDLVENDYKTRLDAIVQMKNKQAALMLLRYCHVTRFTYILRTTHNDTTFNAAFWMNIKTQSALKTILGTGKDAIDFTEGQFLQAQLPIRKGGLGITSAVDTAVPAFAGSLALVLKDLAAIDREVWPSRFKGTFSDANVYSGTHERFSEQLRMDETLSLAEALYEEGAEKKKETSNMYFFPKAAKKPPKESTNKAPEKRKEPFKFPDIGYLTKEQTPYLQKLLSRAVNETTFAKAMAVGSRKDKHRLLSASAPGAGGFLNASLVRFDTRFEPNDFVDAVLIRLGINPSYMRKLLPTDKCPCGKVHDYSDISEILCCRCAGGTGWTSRHDRPKFAFFRIAKEAGQSVKLEKIVGPDGRARVDVSIYDLVIRDSKGDGIDEYTAQCDVSVTCEQSKTNLAKASIKQGMAANERAKTKMSSNGAVALQAPDRFIPCILETHGLLHKDFRFVLKAVAGNHTEQSVKDGGYDDWMRGAIIAQVINGYYQQISVALMKGLLINIRKAVNTILRFNNRDAESSKKLTAGRAENLVGNILYKNNLVFDSD